MTRRDPHEPLAAEYVPVRSEGDAEVEATLLLEIENSRARGDSVAVERSVFALAAFCSRSGRQRRAVSELERLAAPGSDPDLVARSLLAAGQLLEQVEDFDGARARYARGVEIDAGDHRVRYFLHNNLAFCLLKLGRPVVAEPLCRASIAIDPRRHNARKNLGLALAAHGRLHEAAVAYLDAVELAPRDMHALMHLRALVADNPQVIESDPTLRERLDRALAAGRRAEKARH